MAHCFRPIAVSASSPPSPNYSSDREKSPSPDDIITLQVGECRFTVKVSTLTLGSGYFSAAFSGHWRYERLPDGSYLIDQDGDTFEHVLRYLRSYSIGAPLFPLLFDQTRGHDYAMYQQILAQACYFEIPSLKAWLEDKKYLNAVEIERSANLLQDVADIDVIYGSNVKLEYYPLRGFEKVYLCPRGIRGHKGKPQSCGKDCHKVQGPNGKEYVNEEVLRLVEVRSEIVFKPAIVMDGS
ncbi:MAG: hypothetical protein Q9163_002083 [Psora crenata]